MLLINGVFDGSYKLFWADFRLTIFMSKFLRWVVAFLFFFVTQMRNRYLNTGLKSLLKYRQFSFSVLQCWVTCMPLKSTCVSAKWYHWLAWISHQMLHASLCEYSISLSNLSTFLLLLILSHDRDHVSKYFHICRWDRFVDLKTLKPVSFHSSIFLYFLQRFFELVMEAQGNRDFDKKTGGSVVWKKDK